jgi:Cdc6-like AAA superfamily ATPase
MFSNPTFEIKEYTCDRCGKKACFAVCNSFKTYCSEHAHGLYYQIAVLPDAPSTAFTESFVPEIDWKNAQLVKPLFVTVAHKGMTYIIHIDDVDKFFKELHDKILLKLLYGDVPSVEASGGPSNV